MKRGYGLLYAMGAAVAFACGLGGGSFANTANTMNTKATNTAATHTKDANAVTNTVATTINTGLGWIVDANVNAGMHDCATAEDACGGLYMNPLVAENAPRTPIDGQLIGPAPTPNIADPICDFLMKPAEVAIMKWEPMKNTGPRNTDRESPANSNAKVNRIT